MSEDLNAKFVLTNLDYLTLYIKEQNQNTDKEKSHVFRFGFSDGFPYIRVRYISNDEPTRENNFNTIYQSMTLSDIQIFCSCVYENLKKDNKDFKFDIAFNNKEGQLNNILRYVRKDGVSGIYLGNPDSKNKPNLFFKITTNSNRVYKLNDEIINSNNLKALEWIKTISFTMNNLSNAYSVNKKNYTPGNNFNSGSTFNSYVPSKTTTQNTDTIDRTLEINVFDDDIPF